MSFGILFVGLLITFSLGMSSSLFFEHKNGQVGFMLIVFGVIIFIGSIIASLSYPHGFEQLKAELNGDEIAYLSMTTDCNGNLTGQNLAQLNELKHAGFVATASDNCIEYAGCGNSRHPVRWYCEMTLKRYAKKPSVTSAADFASSKSRYDELTKNAEGICSECKCQK